MTMRIGEVAGAAEVNVQTVRYYERRGLLEEPPRTPAGYRQYGPDAVRRVRFIQRAQDVGFTLREIEELLELRVDDPDRCSLVRERVLSKQAEIQRRIRRLERLDDVLGDLASACERGVRTTACPVLEALQDREPDGTGDVVSDPPGASPDAAVVVSRDGGGP